MRNMLWVVGVVLWATAVCPVSAQVKLEWKLKEGDTLFLEEKVALKQNVRHMKTDQIHEMAYTRITRFSVLKKSKDGGYLLEQKVESIRLDKGGAGGKADPKMLRAQEGAVFKLTLTPKLKVAKLEGYEAFVKKIATSDEIAKMVRVLMPREVFVRATEAMFGYLPDKKVNKGDSWATEQTRSLGALGSLKVESTCTLQAIEKLDGKEVVKIDIRPTRSAYSLPPGEGEPSFKVTRGDISLDRETSRTAITFSSVLGRALTSTATVKMTGTLTVSVMGATIALEVEHEEKIASRFLDKNPAQ